MFETNGGQRSGFGSCKHQFIDEIRTVPTIKEDYFQVLDYHANELQHYIRSFILLSHKQQLSTVSFDWSQRNCEPCQRDVEEPTLPHLTQRPNPSDGNVTKTDGEQKNIKIQAKLLA